MKKKIIPVVCATVMLLASCGSGVNNLSISNESELKAEWFVGDAAREVKLTAEPTTFDVAQAITDGKITFTSSNPNVIGVAGKMLTPLTVGTATVSVNFDNKVWDNVELAVIAETPARRYAKYCEACSGATSTAIRGKVIAIESYTGGETKGNVYLQEGIYGYRVNSVVLKQGERTLKVGDCVAITGTGYGSSKAYKALKSAATLEFLEDGSITADAIDLDKAVFATSESAQVKTGWVTVASNEYDEDEGCHYLKYNVGEKEFTVTYNGGTTTKHDAIRDAFEKAKPGHKISAIGTLYEDGVLSVNDTQGFSKEEVKVTGITISKPEYTIKKGHEYLIPVTITPELADNHNVDWEIEDTKTDVIEIVDGVLSVKESYTGGETEVFVKAKAKDGSGVVSNQVNFSVDSANAEAPDTITVTASSTSITEGDTVNCTVAVAGNPGCANKVTWSSSDETVATVDQNGVVTVLKTEGVTITATNTIDTSKKGSVDLAASVVLDDSEPVVRTTAPEIDGEYYLGLYQSNLYPNQMLYANGLMSGTYAGTTRDSASAAKIKVEAGTEANTYKLKVVGGDNNGKYLDCVKTTSGDKTYYDPAFVDSPTATISWDSENNIFTFVASGDTTTRFLGTSNTAKYNTFSFAVLGSIGYNFKCALYDNANPQTITGIALNAADSFELGIDYPVTISTTPANQCVPNEVVWSVEGTGANPGDAEIVTDPYTRLAYVKGTAKGEVTISAKLGALEVATKVINVIDRTTLASLTFPAKDQTPISSYETTWAAKDKFDNEFSMVNFNNNNNGWSSVKCGRKSVASTGSIITPVFDKVINSVKFTIANLTASKITSITVYKSATPEDASSWTSVRTVTDKTKGEKTVTLTDCSNVALKLEFVCASGSSNGLIEISQVVVVGVY